MSKSIEGSRLSGNRLWLTLYGVMAVLTLIFQIYVHSPQCAPDCTLSYAKAVVWSVIWPASWVVYLAKPSKTILLREMTVELDF